MRLFPVLVVSYRIAVTTSLNRLIYFFRRLPLIGRLLPEKAYACGRVKDAAAALMGVARVGGLFVGKALYLALCCYLPLVIRADGLPAAADFPFFVHILVFLSFLTGSLIGNEMLQNAEPKYICLRLMRMPTRPYLLGQFLLRHGGDLLGFLPVLALAAALFGRNPFEGAALAVALVCWHMAGNALGLLLFDKTVVVAASKGWVVLPALAAGLLLGYAPLVLDWHWGVAAVVLHPLFLLVSLIAGGAAFVYVWRYPRFRRVAMQTVTLAGLQNTAGELAGIRFADVKLRDQDLRAEDEGRFARLNGYRYLNAIFFARHRRLLLRPCLIRLTIVAVLFAGALGTALFDPELAGTIAAYLPGSLPLCVFLMYLLTSTSERICRAMFGNCDVAMLRYGFYRRPRVLLENFRIRLLWMLRPNLAVAGGLAAAMLLFAAVCGIPWSGWDRLLFALSLLLLAAFFTVHYLFLYYVFQPYTSELAMKNPFYGVINSVVYVVCLLCLRLDSTPAYFTLIVLGATLLYIAAALLLVYRLAPKRFRVK